MKIGDRVRLTQEGLSIIYARARELAYINVGSPQSIILPNVYAKESISWRSVLFAESRAYLLGKI